MHKKRLHSRELFLELILSSFIATLATYRGEGGSGLITEITSVQKKTNRFLDELKCAVNVIKCGIIENASASILLCTKYCFTMQYKMHHYNPYMK